jgi:hypothetical protein
MLPGMAIPTVQSTPVSRSMSRTIAAIAAIVPS